ncbi:MAG: hypothetical protein ACR2NO_01170 [Chloroflexota bacterium]
MRRHRRPEDVAPLLAAPKCATLATYRRDGILLLSRVWQVWRYWRHSSSCGTEPVMEPISPRPAEALVL